MESLTVNVNGLNFYVVVDGVGPTVLLLHGFPDSHHLWRHVTPQLVAAGFRVVTFDQRGYGQSDAPVDVTSYTIDRIASDAIGTTDSRNHRKSKTCRTRLGRFYRLVSLPDVSREV